jgi:RNA polymerase sigma factor (sigma-70 family)
MAYKLGEFGDHPLYEVLKLSLHHRATALFLALQSNWPAIEGEIGTPISDTLRWRIAWAIGFNLTRGFVASEARPEPSQLQPKLLRHLEQEGHRTVRQIVEGIRLKELARSVASEQRNDWQPNDVQPVDRAAAEDAFMALFRQCYDDVAERLSKRRDRGHVTVETCVDDAWSRAFECYWSPAATSRYRAAATLAGTISLIALRQTWKTAKESPWPVDRDGVEFAQGAHTDPSRRIETAEEAQKMSSRIAQLPLRQRLVAELVFQHEMSQAEVARKLGTSEANISTLLKKAREKLQSEKIPT